jgi:hypothetical protein
MQAAIWETRVFRLIPRTVKARFMSHNEPSTFYLLQALFISSPNCPDGGFDIGFDLSKNSSRFKITARLGKPFCRAELGFCIEISFSSRDCGNTGASGATSDRLR